MVISAIVTVVLLVVAGVVGVNLMRRQTHLPGHSAPTAANQPTDGAGPAPSQPGNGAPASPPSIQLTRYITDPSGVLAPAGRAAVEAAINRLYSQRNVHLWVAYVNDFAGLTPLRWAENTMRANGFSNSDALLAVATEGHRFSFRAPSGLPGATPANIEAIRRNRIEPAVRESEWARAAVAAANGLETAG